MTNDSTAGSLRDLLHEPFEGHPRFSRDDLSAMSPDQVRTLANELQVKYEELVRTQRETAESRDRYLDLYEFAPVGYLTVGPDCRIHRCNRSAAALLGIDRDNVDGAVLADLVVPEDRDTCLLAIGQTLETGGRQTCECGIQSPACGVPYVQLSITPLVDETPGIGCRVTLTDVTARKLIETKLRQSEESLRFAEQAASVGIWDWRLDTGRIEWTQQLEQIYGFSPGTFPGNYDSFRERVHPDDLAEVERQRDAAVAAHQQFNFDFRVQLPSGEIRWVNSTGAAHYNGAGQPQRVFGANVDITARKLAEGRHQEDQTRLKMAVEASGIGYWDWDLQTNRVHFSPEWKQQIGCRDDEIADQFEEWQSRVHPEDIDYVLQRIEAYLAEPRGRYDVEFRFRHKDGSYRTILAVGMALLAPDGKACRFLGCHIDITERKEAERELLRSKERLELAKQAAGHGVWDWDIPTGEINWSPEIYNMFGLDPDMQPPTFAAWERAVHPADLASARTCLECAVRDHTRFDSEYRVVHSDGKVRWIRAVGRAAYDNSGHALRITGICTDVTEREQTARELERARNQLSEAQRIAHLGSWEYVAATLETIWSGEQKRIYGLDPSQPSPGYEEMLRHRIHPDDAAELDQRFGNALRGRNTFENEHRIVRPDGSVRYIYNKAQPYFDENGKLTRYVGATLDITDRKEAEQELRLSNERLEDILTASRAGTWEWNVQTGETIFNARWAEIAGYTLEELSPTSIDTWIRLVHPDDLPLCRAMQDDHFSGRLDYCDLESRIRHKDGHWVWVHDRGQVIRWTDDGQPLWMRGTHHDITQQKRAEDELRASEARFHAYVNQAADALFVQDYSGRFIEVNPQACASLGYSREELLRMSFFDVEVEFDLVKDQESSPPITPTTPRTVTGRQRRKDGSTFPVEVRVGFIELEGQQNYLCLARDITERKKRELDLERVRNQLSEAQRIAHLGSWEHIAATHETVWSDELKLIYGLSPDQPSPNYEELLRHHVHPDDVAELDARFGEAMQHVRLFESEHRIVRPDGSVRFIYAKALPYFDEAGKLVRYVGVTLDITDRKEAEQKLLRSNERLELAKRAAGQGVWDWDLVTDRLNWSPEIFALFGLDPEAQTASLAAWEAVLHPGDRELAQESLRQSLRDRTLFDIEYRVVHPDGQLRWIRGIGRASYDNAGRPVRMTGIIMDVTERREMLDKIRQWNAELERTIAERTAELTAEHAHTTQAMERVAASESRYRTLVENVSECVWELDVRGRLTYLSPRFEELTGYSVAEFLGKPPSGLLTEGTEALRSAMLQSGSKSRQAIPPMQFHALRKDGQPYDVEIRATKRFSDTGEFLGMQGIVQDITQRVQAEAALKRFNEELEQQVQVRTAAIRVLRDVAVMANEAEDPRQAAEYCLKQLAMQNGWLFGHAWFLTAEDQEYLLPRCVWYPAETDRWDEFRSVTLQTCLRPNAGLPGRAIAAGRPLWTTQPGSMMTKSRAAVAQKLGLRTAVVAPVFARGRAVAALEFFSDRELPRDPKTADVLTGVALQLGRIFERREFEEHLLSSAEDVRKSIAQDLHDDVGQELTGASLMVGALAVMSPPSTAPAVKLSADIAAALSRTHEKLRRLCHSALPMELTEGYLVDALQQLAAFTQDNSRIECSLSCEGPALSMDNRRCTQLYRIVQEAISNAIRHGRPRSIRIAMRQERDNILLTIEDDGRGLSGDLPANHGMGLQTMRYRAGLLGGTLDISPGQKRGTCVVCRVPAAITSPVTPAAAKKASRCRRKS